LLKGIEKLPEDQLDERADSTVKIFTYFDDKDMFYAAFRKSLSKRLLSKKYKEDAERNFIAKLKQSCGDVYTKKLEGMFNDVKVSDERVPAFKAYCDAKGKFLDIDLQVTVLNDLYWPLSKQTEITLPKELVPCVKVFEEYYSTQTDKRRLTWLYNQGTVVLNHTMLDEKKRKRKIELTVSCIQACILLLFNESTSYKFKDVREALGTTEEMLKFAITPLVFSKMRILANRGAEGKGRAKPVKEDDDVEDEGGAEGGAKISAASLQPEDVIQLIPLRTGGKLKIAYPPGHAGMLASERDGMVKKKSRGTYHKDRIGARTYNESTWYFKTTRINRRVYQTIN